MPRWPGRSSPRSTGCCRAPASARTAQSGALRVPGLGMVYASVFGTWLEDDDPGLARTMAALDRRLRRGERTLRGVEQVGTALYRLATEGPGFIRSTMRGRAKPEPTAGTDAAPGTG